MANIWEERAESLFGFLNDDPRVEQLVNKISQVILPPEEEDPEALKMQIENVRKGFYGFLQSQTVEEAKEWALCARDIGNHITEMNLLFVEGMTDNEWQECSAVHST